MKGATHMAITIDDIYDKEFALKGGGYDRDDVDQFLDEICDEMTSMQEKIAALESDLQKAQDELKTAREAVKPAPVVQAQPAAEETIRALHGMGYRTVLATNPLFPPTATQSRVRWAGLTPEDFEFITTYDNSSFCKPNPDYYREILGKLNLNAGECLMVGNDVNEDMIAQTLGMQVFLLTDCLINKDGKDISQYPYGSFPELMDYIRGL